MSHAYSPIPRGFNPRARRGRDKVAGLTDSVIALFQSTRPQGARQWIREYATTPATFQSTRPQGARPCPWALIGAASSFQSTRPQGARPAPKKREV